jgi:hypothetical protein
MISDRRFKELLNLYLDHAATPAEAQELETAVRADPARARLMREYGSLHMGCARLFDQAASRAPASPTLAQAMRAAEARIAAPAVEGGGWSRLGWLLGGTGAVAAAFVLALRVSAPSASVATAPQSATATPPLLIAAVPSTPPAVAALAAEPVPATAHRSPASYSHLTFAGLGLDQAGPRSSTTWGHTSIELASDEVTEVVPVYTAQWLEQQAMSGPAVFGQTASPTSWSAAAHATGFHAELSAFEASR